MSILAGDIKLVASQVMDDVPEGGGAPTSTAIQDGTSNSVFNDISELDRAGGRVNMRKVFASVQTPNTDTYLGANVIVADPPNDPNVSVTIFKTGDVFDQRADARNRVESYLNKGSLWQGFLLENHVVGQRAIQIFHRDGVPPPVVGKTLYLVANEGAGNEYSQYVRVTAVSSELRTFSYLADKVMVDYTARVSVCSLSDALLHDFAGSAPSRGYEAETAKSKIRDTLVADAATYYGATATTNAVSIGDLSANVDSIFTKLVPSAQTETALVDRSLTSTASPIIPAASGTVSDSQMRAHSGLDDFYIYLLTPCQPGTLTVTSIGVLHDDGAGNMLDSNNSVRGTVNYESGLISLPNGGIGWSGASLVTTTYTPAAAVSTQAYATARPVTPESRSYVWVLPLTPLPAPGSVSVSYMSQGSWYDLKDNGAGTVSGTDAAYGAGTVSYTTGTLSVTLGALPDVDSEVIVSWGTKQEYIALTTSALAVSTPRIPFSVGAAVAPGTFVLTWTAGGVAKSASDNGNGSLTGDASGSIFYGSGTGYIVTTTPPASAGEILMAYEEGSAETYGATTGEAVSWSATLPNAPIKPKSVVIEFQTANKWTTPGPAGAILAGSAIVSAVARDNGSGGFVLDGYGTLPGASINYTTGAVLLPVNIASSVPVPIYGSQSVWTPSRGVETIGVVTGYGTSASSRVIAAGGVSARYRKNSDTSAATTGALNISGLELDLTPVLRGAIVPGSLRFKLGGNTYYDRAGSLYHSADQATGAGTPAGSVNYASGEVVITNWLAGNTAFTLQSGLLNPATTGRSHVAGRSAARPIKSQSFSVSATALDGTAITATAAADGTITSAFVAGGVNYNTGSYAISFGSVVSGNWVSKPVNPNSIKYSAVAYSYLPLDAAIIGLDPVRLPQDGRVPIFRAGDFAVIGHTGSVGPFTLANGQTKNCGRVRLSRVRVLGSDGAVINTGYTADLEAGTVTFTDVSGYAQPCTIEHRIEDMVQVSDAQINGRLTFTRQVTHTYPVGSVVSSALIAGDLRARVSALFDQATWSGAYADTQVGSSATATFNDVLAPITVSNVGASTERWAIHFTNSISFNVIGENVGQIATGNTSTNCSPINPATGSPYFTIPATGWGSGWAAGNVLRFNTVGALFPVWVVRTIQQGPETVTNDSFTVLIRGDVDRP